MKIINKDILTVESGIICQQVNCQGVMGSGLAKSIREKWPIVYEEYIKKFEDIGKEYNFTLLGDYQKIPVGETKDKNYPNWDLCVCNIFGQFNYGYDGRRYTDYGALRAAFEDISNSDYKMDIYFPFNFGCDKGGGDWNIVSKMINYYFPNAIICKLG